MAPSAEKPLNKSHPVGRTDEGVEVPLSEEQKLIQETARSFVDRKVILHVRASPCSDDNPRPPPRHN